MRDWDRLTSALCYSDSALKRILILIDSGDCYRLLSLLNRHLFIDPDGIAIRTNFVGLHSGIAWRVHKMPKFLRDFYSRKFFKEVKKSAGFYSNYCPGFSKKMPQNISFFGLPEGLRFQKKLSTFVKKYLRVFPFFKTTFV